MKKLLPIVLVGFFVLPSMAMERSSLLNENNESETQNDILFRVKLIAVIGAVAYSPIYGLLYMIDSYQFNTLEPTEPTPKQIYAGIIKKRLHKNKEKKD